MKTSLRIFMKFLLYFFIFGVSTIIFFIYLEFSGNFQSLSFIAGDIIPLLLAFILTLVIGHQVLKDSFKSLLGYSLSSTFLAMVIIIIWINSVSGLLLPYVPFYNYYGVDPSNESWRSCKGTINVWGTISSSDNMKKLEYWSVMAIKKNNIKLCNNVGIFEGGDVIYANQHKQAIGFCKYVVMNNPSYVLNQCGDVK